MNRRRDTGSYQVGGSIAVAVLVALSAAGCSSDDKPTPKPSSGSTSSPGSSGASSGALRDESAAVLEWTPPAPLAKSEGKLSSHPETLSATVPATAEIISVQAGEASTILTWQLSSATDIPLQGVTLNSHHSAGPEPDAVRLVDPVGKKTYAVNTMDVGEFAYSVCSGYPVHVGPIPVRMTAEYPALPATATTISVQIPNFAPVSVPVTRY